MSCSSIGILVIPHPYNFTMPFFMLLRLQTLFARDPPLAPPPYHFPPPSAPAPSAFPICSNACNWNDDDECDDGGEGNEYYHELQQTLCPYGSDCADCGPRA